MAAPTVMAKPAISEADIWTTHGADIFEAGRFDGSPSFYPVYNFKTFYSYSLLALLKMIDDVQLNPFVNHIVDTQDFLYLPPEILIDRRITRVGGPCRPRFQTTTPKDFIESIIGSLRVDIDLIESANHEMTNLVLCGGKDSLNLLLLPWTNPVVAVSAPPNYELVREFIGRNDLNIELIPLQINPDTTLDEEVLINCCRTELSHFRWGGDLVEIARRFKQQAVYWTGDLGDTCFTPYWRTYCTHSRIKAHESQSIAGWFCSGVCRRLVRKLGLEALMQERKFWRYQWERGAMWQGVHNSISRELTNVLTLSAYHGPNMMKAKSTTALHKCVLEDVRPELGKRLLGRRVWYPDSNPGPAEWHWRKGSAAVPRWIDSASTHGLRVAPATGL